jgi:hypothetical protein
VGPRARKALVGVFMLVFLVVWVVVALRLAAYVPSGWMTTVYFLVAGVGWGVPLFPLFTWAEHGRFFKPRS